MKATILLAGIISLSLGSCAHCDCTKDRGGKQGMRDGAGVLLEGKETSGSRENASANKATGGSGGNDRSSGGGATSSSGSLNDRNTTSGTERTTIHGGQGVGNANTERGVNPYDNDGAPPASTTTTRPKKPGTTGSYRTRATGTGTSTGRQVN